MRKFQLYSIFYAWAVEYFINYDCNCHLIKLCLKLIRQTVTFDMLITL